MFRKDYNFFVFDLFKQNDISSQPIRLDFKFSAGFGNADYVAYVIVLAPKVISINCDGHRLFDLSLIIYIISQTIVL